MCEDGGCVSQHRSNAYLEEGSLVAEGHFAVPPQHTVEAAQVKSGGAGYPIDMRDESESRVKGYS